MKVAIGKTITRAPRRQAHVACVGRVVACDRGAADGVVITFRLEDGRSMWMDVTTEEWTALTERVAHFQRWIGKVEK